MTPEHAIAFEAHDDCPDSINRYFDWSVQDGDTLTLEIGDHTGAAAVRLTWEEFTELHHEMTLTLLARVAQPR